MRVEPIKTSQTRREPSGVWVCSTPQERDAIAHLQREAGAECQKHVRDIKVANLRLRMYIAIAFEPST